MDKETLIKAINQKEYGNSLISIWYNIGRALPFRAQRFPDGRVSEWYKSQFVEVHSVKPSGKGAKYGNAYGFYYRNGERANADENPDYSWCNIDDSEPKDIPHAACGSWVLIDILGEATAEPTKVYGVNDVLEKGKYKGKTVAEVIHSDWNWIKWAETVSEQFFFKWDEVLEERKKNIKILQPKDMLTFGKYKGKTIKDIAENDFNYLRWLADRTDDFAINFEGLKDQKQIQNGIAYFFKQKVGYSSYQGYGVKFQRFKA